VPAHPTGRCAPGARFRPRAAEPCVLLRSSVRFWVLRVSYASGAVSPRARWY